MNPIGEFAFFPLWFGYILVVDALVLRRSGTSLLSRNPVAFWGMFLASVPLWWTFEGINQITRNWSYIGAREYSTLSHILVASWHYSTVIPAVFETAELMGSFCPMKRLRRGPALPESRRFLTGAMGLGLLSVIALLAWPQYAYAVTWVCLILLLDPINYFRGQPSIIGWLRWGDWRLVAALAVGTLVCGWFWEMWNYWAFPKWQYSIALVDFAKVFEMPLLGYAGYLPFGLEVFVAYHFLCGLFNRAPRSFLAIELSSPWTQAAPGPALFSPTVAAIPRITLTKRS